MQRTVNIQIAGNQCYVNGLVGLTGDELQAIAEQLLSQASLKGNTILCLETKNSVEHWSLADLSNRAARMLLLQRL
jgi:hypothetical protein